MEILEPYKNDYKVGPYGRKQRKSVMAEVEWVKSKRYRAEEDDTGFWLIPDPKGPYKHYGIGWLDGKYRYRKFCIPSKVFDMGDRYTRSVVDGKIRFEKVYD